MNSAKTEIWYEKKIAMTWYNEHKEREKKNNEHTENRRKTLTKKRREKYQNFKKLPKAKFSTK